ncbi:MAG: fasciclin domain-containing protein [Verrucomicrobia bacterium]|nr:fasciclin domain-containing protein [Verrucomicrobiota bacterium]
MISGFVVQAPAGQLRWLLIRGVGPTLGQFGVTGTLADPSLRVYDRNGTVIAANDNFATAPNLALLNTVTSAAGAFALGNASEAAVLIGLPAGSYTAQLGAGTGTATGAVLLETYEFGSVAASQASQTITGIAASIGDFSTLTTALRLTGLDAALASGGPFTVFAPTDAAFAKLPAATLNALVANPSQLADVLRYHVVSGQVLSTQLTNGQVAPSLLPGRSLSVTLAPGSVRINASNVAAADVRAVNGVIHVIDTVLVP